jgi:Glycosyl transferases group 1
VRVLIIGVDNPWRMERAVQRAMERAGHETLLFDDRRSARWVGRRLTQVRALLAARRFQPEFVFLSKCRRLDVETVQKIVRDLPNAMWYHDAPYYASVDRPEIGHLIEIARVANVFFVTGFADEWRAHGINARFLPSAAAIEVTPVAPDPLFKTTVSFVGSGYDQQRADFLRALSKRVPTRVYGPGWEEWQGELDWNGGPVSGVDFGKACSSSVFALGILPAVAAGSTDYASNRMWRTILAGGLYLGPWAPVVDKFLLQNQHCIWYTDLHNCVQNIERLLADPWERERIRAAGEALVRQHHTFDARLPYLFSGEPWVNPLEAPTPVAARPFA